MAKNINYVSHKKSKLKDLNGKPQLPSASALVEGEIAVNYAENVETLSIKNESGTVVTFSSDNYYTEKKLGSGFTGENSANTVTSVIESNERVIASSLNDLEARKLDASAYTPTDLSNYYTKSETSGATELSTAFDTINVSIEDLSGQSETVAAALNYLNDNKLDASAYTPTDLSNYYTKTEVDERDLWEAGTGLHSAVLKGTSGVASGDYAIAEGYQTSALTNYSHAEGQGTLANGQSSHAEGEGTKAINSAAHAEGYQTIASYYSHAEGYQTSGTGWFSHAEGIYTKTTGGQSHAEGNRTQTIGDNSHAEGYQTVASGEDSHAEGYQTSAMTYYSHAEGRNTTASGNSSHAEGRNTIASGDYSHAEGVSTIANNDSEHASGQYNVSSSASTTFGDSGNTLFSVGNGTANNARHNAFEIRQNGDIYIVNKDGDDVRLQDEIGNIDVDQVLDDTTSASTNPVSSKAVYKAVTDNELVWTNAYVVISGAISSHTEDTSIHVTSADKTNWNAKLDASDIANFFDDAKYEDSGTTKVINFYNGNTIKATIDATDFIKDGMIDSVSLETTGGTTYLVITWNTDAGKSQTSLNVGDLFDADNYYTKTETSGATELSTEFAKYYTTAQTSGATELSTAFDAIGDKFGSGFTISSVTEVIESNERVISSSLNDLNTRKLDASAYTPTDLSNYYTKSETSGATELSTAFDTTNASISDLSGQSETVAAALNVLNDAIDGINGSIDEINSKERLQEVIAITSNVTSSCSITGSSNSGKEQIIVYTNSTASDLTITVSSTSYNTLDGTDISITCKAGGYSEVRYININGSVFARGL